MPGRRVEVDAVPVVVIDSLDQVRALGERILDAARAEPVVCVTTRHNAPKPLLDVETVAAAVAPLPIHVLGTGELTWELNAILPERFEVYGGASRIWWPGLRPTDDARRHPLIFCWADYEAPEAARRVLRELDRWGLAVERGALGSPPATTFPFRSSPVSVEPVAPVAGPLEGVGVHDVVEATVVEVQRGGTEVELAGGLRCLILTKRGRPAPAVRRGDVVPVKVIAVNSADRRDVVAADGDDASPCPAWRIPHPTTEGRATSSVTPRPGATSVP
jgi:hypothetical protein